MGLEPIRPLLIIGF